MASWTIRCSLLYRIRASDRTYVVPSGVDGPVEIELHTTRTPEFDPRIGTGKDVEFLVDRFGWASYSDVTAQLEASDARQALRAFLSALNYLIAQARDLFDIPWMHEVERDDLFNLTIGTGGSFRATWGYGRTGGFRAATAGLTDSAEELLARRLASYKPVAPWRILELDAADALASGRYEESVVLAWSALESGCRTTLPELARESGLAPAATYRRLTGRSRRPTPWSHEEAINRPPRPPSVVSLIRLTAELASTGFEPDALAASAGHGYRLRNRIVHNGGRLTPESAREAVASIRWCLQALGLPRTVQQEQSSVDDWVNHFGEMSLPLDELLGPDLGRLTVVHFQERGVGLPISVERIGQHVTVGLPEGLSERDAAVLAVVMHGAFFPAAPGLPSFFVASTGAPLVHGLLVQEARALNSMLGQYVTLRMLAGRWDVQDSINRTLEFYESTTPDIALGGTDLRLATVPAHLAPFGAIAREDDWRRCVDRLRAWDERVAERAERWATLLRSSPAEDLHSLCDLAKGVHSELMLFDNIHIDCPTEKVVHGLRTWSYSDYESSPPQ